ncbi:hypothetical protein ACOMHN_000718 [Nucella lapillus]
MKTQVWELLALWCAWCLPGGVRGHGRMLLPPSRPTAWRLGFDSPVNYDDNQQYCGGRVIQKKYGHKCGICGDPWEPIPRPYERPDGQMVMQGNFILSTYRSGARISASVQITASHMGYFEFFLCNVDELEGSVEATLDCLLKHPLSVVNKGGSTRYSPVTKGVHDVTLQLPPGLVCHHCVLQWKYTAGNDWNNGCMGCGAQEEFYSCADLSITRQDGSLPPSPSPSTLTTTRHPFHFIPKPLRPSPTQTEAERDPPTQEMIRFFLCTYCMEQLFSKGVWPDVCLGKMDSIRACPRSLPY